MTMESKTAAASFVWNDPFLLEDQLAEDERMLRDAAPRSAPTSSRRGSASLPR